MNKCSWPIAVQPLHSYYSFERFLQAEEISNFVKIWHGKDDPVAKSKEGMRFEYRTLKSDGNYFLICFVLFDCCVSLRREKYA